MELDIFNKIKENNLVNDFVKELKEAMKDKEIYLTSEEQRIYSNEEYKVYESLENDYYILHNIYNDDRYKIKQCRDGKEILTVIHKENIEDVDIKIGDVLKKVNNKYVLDKEKSNEIKEKLKAIKKQIVDLRK